jgi:hypothetical protein
VNNLEETLGNYITEDMTTYTRNLTEHRKNNKSMAEDSTTRSQSEHQYAYLLQQDSKSILHTSHER